MTLPPYMKVQGDVVYLALKVQPRAQRNEICGTIGGELKVRVTAPPVDSAANDALIRFLAETIGCPRGAVRIVRGETSRHKTVSIAGAACGEVIRRLGD